MLTIPYSLVIEALRDRPLYGFYCPALDCVAGVSYSIDKCIEMAQNAIAEEAERCEESGEAMPPFEADPTITIRNQKQD